MKIAKILFYGIVATIMVFYISAPFAMASWSDFCKSNTQGLQCDTGGLVPCGGEKDSAGKVANPCTFDHFIVLADRVIQFSLFYIAIPVAIAFIVYGGILIMTSGGDTGKVAQAKTLIQSVVVGLLISFGAFILVQTLLNILFG